MGVRVEDRADLVLIWIVAQLAPTDSRTRALQYALNPLSLLIVSLHGQVEPVALAFGLGGLLLLRSGRPVLAGVLIGAAIAAKTWPVAILVAALSVTNLGRSARIVAGAVIVPAACLLSGVIFLDTHPLTDLRRMATYSSYVENWTWSGFLVHHSDPHAAGYNSSLSKPADLLIVAGIVVVLVLLRHRPPEERALGVLCAVLIGTAGLGYQYLLWVLPLAIALSGFWRYPYLLAATGWTAAAYLHRPVEKSLSNLYAWSWAPALALVAIVVELVRRARRSRADELREAAAARVGPVSSG